MTPRGDRKAVLAGLPVLIYLVILLLEWAWAPVLFERTHYTVWGLVLIGITAPGALIGVRQRLPTWSYAWVVFALWEASALLGARLAEGAESPTQLGLMIAYPTFAAYLVIIVTAAVVGTQRFQHAVLVVLLAFFYGTLSFPVIDSDFGLGQTTATIATSGFAAMSVVQAAIAAAVVYRIVRDRARDNGMSLWLLSGIVTTGPMFNAWSGYLGLSGSSLSQPLTITVAATGTIAIMVIVSLLLVKGALALRSVFGRPDASQAQSGVS